MTGSFAVNHNTFNNALGLYVKNLELRSFAKMLANNAFLILQKKLFGNCIKVIHLD